ncbi:MAG: alkaline phosphatase family protein [Flavobacteriales bacterium]|nr:MAG: alkaline phosphatase family protein [Flavobacteriales bacterium]
MKRNLWALVFVFPLAMCKTGPSPLDGSKSFESIADITSDFTIAFGSCNKTNLPNLLWDDIIATNPDLWIWGGDNIYADTDDPKALRQMYQAQNRVEGYQKLKRRVPIIGTWDDNEYGKNDGGVEFNAKKESQGEFFDFIGVAKDDPIRKQEGVYSAHEFEKSNGSIKIIMLDTRFFRTALTSDPSPKKRFKPNAYGLGTLLGEVQWNWLETELRESKADFTVIVSSIQVLSNEHGFECWGNFPHEVDRLKNLLVASKAKGVIMLSGDRHISEFSGASIPGMAYPLIDFTSSGLTHVYSRFKNEPNSHRVGTVVAKESFGLLQFDLDQKKVFLSMLGDNGSLYGRLQQTY